MARLIPFLLMLALVPIAWTQPLAQSIDVKWEKIDGVKTSGRSRDNWQMALSDDGSKVHVIARSTGMLYTLDGRSGRVLNSRAIGNQPTRIVARDGNLWIHLRASQELVVLDASTYARKSAFASSTEMAGLTARAEGPPRVYVSDRSKPRVVRVFDSRTLRELQGLTLPQPRRQDTGDTVERLEHRLTIVSGWRERAFKSVSDYDPAKLDQRIRDIRAAAATPGLNETGRTILEQAARSAESSRDGLVREGEMMKRRVTEYDTEIAKLKVKLAKLKAPPKPARNASIADLGLKFGTGKGRTSHSHDGQIRDLTISRCGRFFYGGHSVRYLIDGNKLLKMESALTGGGENWSVSADGQFIESPGTGGEGYKMHSYSTADLEYRVTTHESGAYPRACAHDRTWPFLYAQEYDHNLLIFNEWTGQRLKTLSITRRGDDVRRFFPLPASGHVLVALESGLYLVRVRVANGLYTPNWKLTSTPWVIARAGQPYVYQPTLGTRAVTPSFRLEQAPTGMRIDARTGKLTWTPTGAQAGRHRALMLVRSSHPRDPEIRQPIVIHVVR